MANIEGQREGVGRRDFIHTRQSASGRPGAFVRAMLRASSATLAAAVRRVPTRRRRCLAAAADSADSAAGAGSLMVVS